jgi:hypothetical protein
VILSPPQLIFSSDEANQFSISRARDKDSATLTFDHMDQQEEAVIQFFHTGVSSDDVEIQGKVQGAGVFTRIPSRDERFARNVRLSLLAGMLGLFVGVIMGGPVFASLVPLLTQDRATQEAIFWISAAGLVLGVIAVTVIVAITRRESEGSARFHEPF